MRTTIRALKVMAVAMLAACGGDSPTGTTSKGSIRGTVTDAGGAAVANVAVALSGNAQAGRTTSSGADGVYTFADVPAGTYTLAVTAPTGFSIGSSGTTSVSVTKGSQANATAFVLDRNGSVSGVVRDNIGAGVPNTAIELTGNQQAARTTTSGADGAYLFADVPTGTYTVTVTPPAGFTLGTSTVSVTVASGAEANAAALVLNPVADGSIRGTVTDIGGAGVANAPVALVGNGQGLQATKTGSDGAYTFTNLVPGSYMLVVTLPPGFVLTAPQGPAFVTVTSGAQAEAPAFIVRAMTAQEADSAFTAGLDTYLNVVTAAGQFSGAVLVKRNGTTLFEGAYGLANRAAGVPNTVQTKFRVGSMNKMITAVSTLQLVQAGTVRLDVPLNTYLSDYPNTELASKVKLHHLLTHTGGTGDIFGPAFNANRLQLRNTSDYVKLYGSRDLAFEPGSQWAYSNYGFILLGAVIERMTAMTYDDYVSARVFAPAGMTATAALPEDSVVPERAVGYTMVNGSLVSNASTLPYRGTPAGGGYSTVRDMALFAEAVRENRLLDPAHTELLLRGKVATGPQDQYAYGFTDRIFEGRRFVGHSGGAAGMNGELVFEPDGGYVVVVLSNLDPPAAAYILGFILPRLPK